MQHAKQQEDWAIVLRFYPNLTELEARLSKIDPSLVADFRSSLLTSKRYKESQIIVNQIEQGYLENFFGNDPLIIDFARDLLIAGKRDGAKELNGAIKVVGKSLSAEKIIEQLEKKYLPNRQKTKAPKMIKVQQKQSFDGTRAIVIIGLVVIIAAIWVESSMPKVNQQQVSSEEINKELLTWSVAISEKVQLYWLKPTDEMVTCNVYIQQSRDGTINQIAIRSCEGIPSEAYKKSIELAVKNASPLPHAPSDASFKSEIMFIFKPK